MPESQPLDSSEKDRKPASFQGTSIGSHKTSFEDDVTALIEETLAEVKPAQKQAAPATGNATPFSTATPMTPATVSPDQMKATRFAVSQNIKPVEPKEVAAKPFRSDKSTAPAAEKPKPKKAPTGEESIYDVTFKEYNVGDIVPGLVVKVEPNGALVDIDYGAEGWMPSSEASLKSFSTLTDILKAGDRIKVMIMELETKEGYVSVSKRHADQILKWDTAYEAFKNKTTLEGNVTSVVRGGLVVDCGGIRGFIPASQVLKGPETPLESFVGKTLPIKILEIDRRQGKVVLSHKIAAAEQQKGQSSKILDELEVGQTRRGTVTSLKKFGAFVDLGGIEGLIHITEMSWRRIKHPSDFLKVGEEIDVFVLGVDKEEKKVALGLKQLQADPWVEAAKYFPVGAVVKGTISRLTKFGAFVDLDHNLEGLIHISELSVNPVTRPEDAVKPGDAVSVKVLRIVPEEQKIGLSIREVVLDEERKNAGSGPTAWSSTTPSPAAETTTSQESELNKAPDSSPDSSATTLDGPAAQDSAEPSPQ